MTTRGDRLNEEIAFHIEQQTARNIRKGMSPDEARRAALRTFGGVEQVREATRDEFRGAWVADLARDARIAMRTIARAPSFAVTAIVTFALGVGAAAAMYSVFEGVLLRPLPYPDADRIVRLYQLGDSGARGNVSEPNFNDWRNGTRAFAAMAETASLGATPISGAGDAQLARVALVSAPFFDVMGVAPVRGRAFTDDERRPGGPRVAIVSAAFWIPWKGTAAPNGEVIRSGTDTFTIVGVMPSGFDYPTGTAVWLPREMNPPQTSRTAHNFQVVARLADGVPLERARNEISSLSRALKARYGDETWMADATAIPLLEVVTSTSKATLQLLFAASILLLLVACTNVSNLLVARAAARRAEFAVQLSMGATSGRIGRQLLAETLVLAMAGTALGVVLAIAAVHLFVMLAPASVQRLDNVSVSWSAVALAVAASALAAVVLSLITALGTRTTRIADALADQARSGAGSRRQLRLREGLIVVQVALTLVLLAGAALLGRSLDKVLAVAPGYSLDDALVVDVTIPGDDTERAAVRQVALQESIMQRLRALPGVSHVGLVNTFPIGSGGANGMFIEMSRPDEITTFDRFTLSDPAIKAHAGSAEFRLVGGDYFAAMAIPLVRGRFIDERDGPGAPHVAVISQSLVDAHWPGRDPIGRWIQFGNMDGDMTGIQVVGVVGDVREQSPEAPPAPMLYVSSRQRPGQGSRASIVVRGPEPRSIADPARRIVRDLDPEVPVTIRTVADVFDTVLGGRRFAAWLVSAFGVTALVLAMLGVYGLVAFMVAQRRREMGIRMALGAQPASLVWLVVSRGAALAVAGALVGIVVSRAASGLLEGMLFGVAPGDAVTIGAAVAVLLLVSAGASYAPARRILEQSPARTLRDA